MDWDHYTHDDPPSDTHRHTCGGVLASDGSCDYCGAESDTNPADILFDDPKEN